MRTSTSFSIVHRAAAALTATAFAFGTLASNAKPAYADEVSPHGKGVVGGVLLGAEIVTIPMGIAEVRSPWAYIVGGGLGAIAGGIGGYEVEQHSSDGRAPAYLLVGGLGLIIPALVLSLNSTRYVPTETAVEDRAPTNAPPANPGSPAGASVSPAAATPYPSSPAMAPPAATAPPSPAGMPQTTPSPSTTPQTTTPGGGTAPPLSLFDVQSGTMRMGVPIPEVRPVFTIAEMRQYGMAAQTEVRMPLVKVSF